LKLILLSRRGAVREEEEEEEKEEEEEEEEEEGEDSNLSKLDGDSIVLWCYLFSLLLRCSRTSVGLLLRRRQGHLLLFVIL